jgi:hypothetical protein
MVLPEELAFHSVMCRSPPRYLPSFTLFSTDKVGSASEYAATSSDFLLMPIIDAFVKQRQSWTVLSLTRVDWRMNPSQHYPPIAKLSADWTGVQGPQSSKELRLLQLAADPGPLFLHGSATTARKGSILHLQNVWGACERPLAEWRNDPKSRCLGHSMRALWIAKQISKSLLCSNPLRL